MKTQVVNFCTNEAKDVLLSPSCLKGSCGAFRSTRRFSIQELSTARGNPGFILCSKLDARAEMVEISTDTQFYSLDRCIFGDGSFVDTGTLVDHYLDRNESETPIDEK